MYSLLPPYEVVVPTRNRAAVLAVSLPTLLGQSHPPDRLIVVDASDDPAPVERAVAEVSRRFTVPTLFLRSERGLCVQRNVGLARVRAPITFFPDDDSLWHPGAAEAICRVYGRDVEGRIGGVCAAQAATPPAGALEDVVAAPYRLRLADRLKNRLQPMRAKIEHAVFPDPFILHGRERIASLGVPAWLSEEDAVPVEWMTGFRMTVRTEPARRAQFDETLRHYGLFEDVDISFALMRSRLVVGARRAAVYHYRDPSPRDGQGRLGLQQVLNRAYIVAKHSEAGSLPRRRVTSYGLYKASQYAGGLWRRGGRERLAGAIRGVRHGRSLASADVADIGPAYRSVMATA